MISPPPKVFYNRPFQPFTKTRAVIVLVFFLVLPLSCAIFGDRHRQKEPLHLNLARLAVAGFQGVLSETEDAGLFRCPLCGSTFMAEPVTEEFVTEMTRDLFHYLENVAPCTLVPPARVNVTYATMLSREMNRDVVEVLTETGRSFSADAVLFGYVYRWKERKGTRYSVDAPASVAFDLHVLRSRDGSVLWEGSFNKTQLSLSENLLDFSTFIRSGGKWLTARELARIGLEKLVRQFCPPK